MDAATYLADPCRASSLPFWKSAALALPAGLSVYREDELPEWPLPGSDEPYFKLIHDLRSVSAAPLPPGFAFAACSAAEHAELIRACYPGTDLTGEGLAAYRSHPVYDPALWVAVADSESGRIVAGGIGELDARIGEGVLEWVQVAPAYRRRGLGRAVVCELLRRMRPRARFANESRPLELYRACGFRDPVIWHVVREV